MRKLFTVALFAAALAAPSAARAQQGTGLGVILGEPTGLTARFSGGVQAHAAWSFAGDDDAFFLAVDKLMHLGNLDIFEAYWGIGASALFASEFALAARVPIGLSYFFRNDPVQIFGEVVPGVQVVPDVDFDIRGGIGVRYFFQ